MNTSSGETIYAPATGVGRAAIAVVRISGPDTRRVVDRLCGKVPSPRRATLVSFHAPAGGEMLDRGLVLWFPGPHSFTGEDSAEFHIHGGRAVVAGLLEGLAQCGGTRPAEPGEFTRRAYVNGRMDLTSVEGLADLIDAETRAQRRQALLHLEGPLGKATEAWRAAILQASALVEASIDFADEGDVHELGPETLDRVLRPVAEQIAVHLSDRNSGIKLREGYTVVIAGPPNAGKSTLLNTLAKQDVAIVSPHAGTTRDPIEVHLDLDGLPIVLVDTAGIRDSADPVEQQGIARARHRAGRADLVLWLTAADDPAPAPPPEFGPAVLDVRTKADRLQSHCPPKKSAHVVSALEGTGIDALLRTLQASAAAELAGAETMSLTRQRHVDALVGAAASLDRVLTGAHGAQLELLAEELRIAARHLGRVAGRIDVEDILGEIFQRFCIGK